MSDTQVLRVTLDELRKLVAEHVYGWKRLRGAEVPDVLRHGRERLDRQEVWVDEDGIVKACKFCGNMPPWESDHNAAFEVVARMRADHWLVRIDTYFTSAVADFWHYPPDKRWPDNNFKAEGTTVPIAICRAALATKGIHVEVVQ